MHAIGHFTIEKPHEIAQLRAFSEEVSNRYTQQNPIMLHVNNRVRAEFSSLDPLMVEKEYGVLFKKGELFVATAALAGVVWYEMDHGNVIAPLLAVESPNNLYYGFATTKEQLQQIATENALQTITA